MTDAAGSTLERLRLDVWLDVACLFKTRSESQKACKGGKIDVNGQRAKPHREVTPGDRIAITRSFGGRQVVVVKDLVEQHVPKAVAKALYEDVTPPPSQAEAELRELVRLASRAHRPGWATTAPGKRERRALRRLKERDS